MTAAAQQVNRRVEHAQRRVTRLEQTRDAVIVRAGTGSQFSGNVWAGAMRLEGYNTDSTKPWVKVNVSDSTVSEELGPPSNPVPDNEVWFEKANTFGDARVDRVG